MVVGIPESATWVRFPRYVGDDGPPSAIASSMRSGSGSRLQWSLRSGGSQRRSRRWERGK